MNPRMLWHHNYWDGPLSGLMLAGDEKLWFSLVNEAAIHDEYRVYDVYRLPADLLQALEMWHEKFVNIVGGHTTYNPDGSRAGNVIGNREDWDAFYTPYRAACAADSRLAMEDDTLATLAHVGEWREGDTQITPRGSLD